MKKCIYKAECEACEDENNCNPYCVLCNNVRNLFNNANIPVLYQYPMVLYPHQADVETYEILNDIKQNINMLVKNGINIYICSDKKLNGKTSWGIKILQTYFHNIAYENGSKDRGLYLDVSEFILNIKNSFDSGDKSVVDAERKVVLETDLVIFDNIDDIKLTDWDRGFLKLIIKKRLANNLSNIFIGSNLGNKLILKIGEDLKAYVEDNSTVLTLIEKRGVRDDTITSN